MSRLSILVVSPYRSEYGPRQVLDHVMAALALSGYRPVCVVPTGAELAADAYPFDFTVRTLDALATFPRTLNITRLSTFFKAHYAASREIERIAAEEKVKAVYSTSEAIFCGGLAARRLGIPSATHAIGMSIQEPRWVAQIYIRLLDRLTDQFIASSSAVAEMFADNGVDDDKIVVVHNGVSTAEIDGNAGEPSPITHDGPKIGMVAAYDSRKGHELFIEGAALIADRHPNARFYVIGGVLKGQQESGAFERRVKALIGSLGLTDRIELVGFVPSPDVYRWIRAMDIIVVPSRTEAFAHALLEAMLCRKPVIATGVEGNLDAFVNGHSGIYIDPLADQLARVLSDVLADPERRQALGDAARERATRFFDLSVTLPANAQIVNHLIASHTRLG